MCVYEHWYMCLLMPENGVESKQVKLKTTMSYPTWVTGT